MIPILEENRLSIAKICADNDVKTLDVFGSAVTGEFNPVRSDVDFLVEFLPGTDLGPWMQKYFELKSSLESTLGFPVDLVMAGTRQNPYFAKSLSETRRGIFAA